MEAAKSEDAPLLVRGTSGLFDAVKGDNKAIGNLVAEVLKDCCWGSVDLDSITVEDKSGFGGSKTYKVSAPGMDPEVVAVHARCSDVVNDPVCERRIEAGGRELAAIGAAPRRFAQGGDWFVEAWGGAGVFVEIPGNLSGGNAEAEGTAAPESSSDAPWAVTWHINNHVDHLVSKSESTARGKYDALVRQGLWASSLYSPNGKCLEHFGREDLCADLDKRAAEVQKASPWVVTWHCNDHVEHITSQSESMARAKYDALVSQGMWASSIYDPSGCCLHHFGRDDLSADLDNKAAEVQKETDAAHGEMDSATNVQEMAQLLARIHKIPTNWFDSFREQLGIVKPALQTAKCGSCVWWPACRVDQFLGDVSDEQLLKVMAAEFLPSTKAGAQIVTCHGDFHEGNIIRDSRPPHGLIAIDLENVHVNHAIVDIAYAFKFGWAKKSGMRRAFAKAYLNAMGDLAIEQDVDDLVLEAECYRGLALFREVLWTNPSLYEKYLAVAQEAMTSSTLREDIIDNGLLRCSRIGAMPKISSGPSEDDKQNMLAQLISLGVAQDKAASCLEASGWASVEAAIALVFAADNTGGEKSSEQQNELVQQVMNMGFDAESSRRALESTGWTSVEAAVAKLFDS